VREARPRVVVVGAGFAGLRAVHRLSSEPVDVTLVDRHNYNTFQPLLYQVATAGLDEGGVAHTIRAIFANDANVEVQLGTVLGIDFTKRAVALDDGGSLDYDALVLAAGATTNDFGIPGVAEFAFPLYTLSEAIDLRQHVLNCFEDTERDPALVDGGALTVVIVGGGPTGVETAGMLAELFTKVLPKGYRRADVSRARVIVIEMGTELLANFRPASRENARETLADRGVDVRFGERVAEVSARGVRLESGEEVMTRTVVWTAGVRPNPLADLLGLQQGAGGRIQVEPDLSVPERPEVFVIGDLAASQSRSGQLLPQLAPVAMQAGTHAGEQVLRHLHGRPTQPFRYRDKGTMATIGRHAAVADLPFGITLRGPIAWLAWLVLHLYYLIGFENRAQVLVQWAWNYCTWNWGPRLVIHRDP
jgi:NADH dehydrogenase